MSAVLSASTGFWGDGGFVAAAGDGAAGAGESTDFIDEAPEMGVLDREVVEVFCWLTGSGRGKLHSPLVVLNSRTLKQSRMFFKS